MIKKISAIILALVLCLSVVVVPASALELADGMNIAFELKWDKEYYNPGDTAYLQLYMKATDDMQLGTGTIVIGLNSAQIAQADNAVADMKAASYGSDLWNSFYRDNNNTTFSWLKATVANSKIVPNNTEAENATYDQYFKHTINRNTSDGTHENALDLKYGLPGADINAIDEPFFTYAFVVSKDAAVGTKLDASITSGTVKGAQTAFKYIKNPGVSTTASVAATAFDVSTAVASSTIGAAMEYEKSIVSYWKDQIRMDKDDYSEFSIRHLAQISKKDWEANFGTTEESANATITDIGFILATGNGSFNKDDAAKWLQDGAKDNSFTKKPVSYVSTGMSGNEGNYVFSVVITGCTDKTASLSSLGYVVWKDAEGTTHYSYFDDVKTETFTELYDGYVAAH